MCPPAQAPPANIGVYLSDDEIFSLLDRYAPGSCLPTYVLAEASPYQYPPSNLPEGIWYLMHSNEKRESVYGFWRAKGEAQKICPNSVISGWRTTLEYLEGQAPDGQTTNWLMHEYKITQNELSDKDKTKDSILLCRVFLSDGHGSKPDFNSKECKLVESKQIDSPASITPLDNIASVQESGCESKDKKASKTGLLPASDEKQHSCTDALPDLDCLLRGDYLEMNDLEDPESHSSSSQNSSCPSQLSDEYFDSIALMRDLEEDIDNKYTQENHSSSRYSYTVSGRPNELVVQPAASGTVMAGPRYTAADESPQACSTQSPNTRVQDHSTKRHKPERRGEGTSSSSDAASSSPDQKNEMPNREKKAGSGKGKKKLKLYCCFRPF